MKGDAALYVRSCKKCGRMKTIKGKKVEYGDLGAIERGELIGIDVFTGLPRTKDGYESVIVMTDYVTKWATVKAIKGDVNAAKAGEALIKKWYLREGPMKRVISDRGPEFVNEVVEWAMKYLEIRKHKTTRHRPQCNGQVERMNRTLGEMLRVYVQDNPEDWKEYLEVVIWEYNNS
jgi:hypothetical protein